MLGADLCEAFEQDHDVIGLDILESNMMRPGLQSFHKADISDADAVRSVIERVSPDIVIHAAAWTDVDGCELDHEKAERINIKGSSNVVDAIRGTDTPMVFISTDFVFDGTKGSAYSEEDAPNPVNYYGMTKYQAEKYIADNLKDYFIVRTSWLYGRNGKNFVDTVLRKGRAGDELRIVDDQTGSPTFSKDLAGAIRILVRVHPRITNSILHVSNSGCCSWYGLAEEIFDVLDIKKIDVKPISSDVLERAATRPGYSVLDNGTFERDTGHKMRPWQEALGEYLEDN